MINVEILRKKHELYPTSYRCKRDSLNRAPFLLGLRLVIAEWNVIKLKSFCTVKGTIS